MIAGLPEIRRSLGGALLLARGDAAGMGRFDLSVGGFWRSFTAPLLAAPAFALLVAEQQALRAAAAAADPAVAAAAAGMGATVLAESASYLVDAVTFPLLAIPLTRFLGLGSRYVPLVVATNWAGLPQVAAFLAAVTLSVAVPPLRPPLLLAVLFGTMAYQWFVVRVASGATGAVAAAMVIINLLVGMMLTLGLDALFQAPSPAVDGGPAVVAPPAPSS